jgi:hypothetical protein
VFNVTEEPIVSVVLVLSGRLQDYQVPLVFPEGGSNIFILSIGPYLLDYIITTRYFYAEDGISGFLQKVVTYLPDYMASQCDNDIPKHHTLIIEANLMLLFLNCAPLCCDTK